MFDEVKDNQAAPPVNSRPVSAPLRSAAPAARTEDIFAEVDKTAKPEIFQPRPGGEPPRGTVVPKEIDWQGNKIIVFSLILGGLIVVAAGGYFGLKLAGMAKPAANKSAIQTTPKNTEANTPSPAVEANLPAILPPADINNQAVPPPLPAIMTPVDTDQDGLTDEEEAAISTDPNNFDTDQDGLTDREEVKVYLTDPLNSDTDGDGFKDGDEVKNGYSPKGAGKLLDINSAK
jgi:hypothetical protein